MMDHRAPLALRALVTSADWVTHCSRELDFSLSLAFRSSSSYAASYSSAVRGVDMASARALMLAIIAGHGAGSTHGVGVKPLGSAMAVHT
jgi:hypothetical protein